MQKIIETQRLILRPWTIGDAADLFAYAKSDKVGPRAGWPPHKTIDDSKAIIEKFIEEDDTWAIIYKEDGIVIGSVGLHKRHVDGIDFDYELGYVLSEDYWGLGIMPEACNAALDYAFNDGRAETILCGHFTFNMQSKRVIEKLHFKPLKHVENAFKRYDGEVFDEELYLLTKQDYEEWKLFSNPNVFKH